MWVVRSHVLFIPVGSLQFVRLSLFLVFLSFEGVRSRFVGGVPGLRLFGSLSLGFVVVNRLG